MSKKLDRGVFAGLSHWFVWAAVDKNGEVNVFKNRPSIACGCLWEDEKQAGLFVGEGFDATDWQNSLIHRYDE